MVSDTRTTQEDSLREPFPESAQRVLDTLYTGQKSLPIVIGEKIQLLESLGNGKILSSFENGASVLRAYEFTYLTRLGVL